MSRRAAAIGAGVLALVLAAAAVITYRAARAQQGTKQGTSGKAGVQSKASALAEPEWTTGHRITVEVINATRVRGLARRAAITLRDHGFDVVSTGTNTEQFDSTQVLDRSGHRDWAVLAAKAMGGGAVLVRPDSSREVDLTVLIGASWHPPTQPFYP